MINHNNPKLSIIIATYNVEQILPQSLNSIIKQKFDDWECIIIDGASKDNTISIIQNYISLDSRISFISEADSGIYDAFNKGWKNAKGEWIYYLGADDVLLETGFQDLFSKNINDFDIIYANVIYRTPIGLNYIKSNKNIDDVNYNLQCSHQGFIMKRSCIEQNNGFNNNDYRLCADYDLILRAYKNHAKMQYININLAIFDITGTSGNINLYKECFLIRKRNESTNILNNCLIYTKGIIIFNLRKVKYTIIKSITYLKNLFCGFHFN